ncbi:MAG: ribosomal protein S18-alanine N-acetyltransferase [Acidobacteria bacterium]|nr:ribosomal protein S18-alanine N-acetyltransferase [Acidobacteriota bacterium]
MERKIVLRNATAEDVESILDVQHASAGAGAWELGDYASALADGGIFCLLAEDRVGERVVGFLVGRTVPGEFEILNLAVKNEYRRQGIGRRLLGEALARAHGQGARRCWLEVRASNQPARDFYRALGFAESARRQRYYRDPEDDAVVCLRQWVAAGPAP